MAYNYQDWDDLGRKIEKIIDRAICSHDYQELNQTIRQVVDRAVDAGSEAVRKAVDGSNRSKAGRTVEQTPYERNRRRAESMRSWQQAQGGSREIYQSAPRKEKLPVLYGSTNGKTTAGILKIVGGSLLSCFACLTLLASAVFNWLFVNTGLIPVVLSLGGLGAGVGLICSGVSGMNRISRFKAYRKAIGQKTYCTLEKLAQSVGKSVKFVRKELSRMIDDGLFLQGHMDKEQTCLITSHETYQHYEQSRLMLEERKRQEATAQAQEAAREKEAAARRDPRVQEVLDRGNAFIAEIRRCNDAIPGEEISAKIYRMEMIIRMIFERAEAHPEIVPDLKKLMDYYLPMTVKLLNAYADMDAQPVQGENIQSSKREIEDTLDTLNRAFEKLLDSVFADTAMDVSSDISVLNTLLAQEGLTEDDLSKMKQQKNL